jgi:phospholipid/cholesterol/gamma-HCH transport system substrate-binding protein
MIQKVELKVGLFLVVTSIIIGSALGYVAYKKGFFAKIPAFTLAAKSGEDLTEGMPVVFSGFKIGTVETLELSADGSVLIKIKVPEQHVKWLKQDSTFIVNKPLIGSPRIVVVTNNLQSPLLSPKHVPEVTHSSDINDTIKKAQPLLDKITNIAGNVEVVTAGLKDPEGKVQQILAHTEQLTDNLSRKKSLVEMAISDQKSIDALYAAVRQTKEITQQLADILQKVDKMAVKTDTAVYGEAGSLPLVNKALQDVLTKLQHLNTTVDNINKISGDAAGATSGLIGLREQVDATVAALNALIRDIDKKIPFKKTPEIKLP